MDKFFAGLAIGMIAGVLVQTYTSPSERNLQLEAIEQGHAEWHITQGPPNVEYEFRWIEKPAVENGCAEHVINAHEYMTRSE